MADKPIQNDNTTNDFSSTQPLSLLMKLDQIDKKYSEKIHLLEVNQLTEIILYISARFYNPECVTVYFFMMLAYYSIMKGDYFFIFKPVLHVLVILLITLVLKYTIARQRPNLRDNVKRMFNVRNREKNCSMPSGDAMQAANFGVIMICYMNSYYGLILIPFVMISRIFYSCHYIMDTIVGALLGLVLSSGLFVLLK